MDYTDICIKRANSTVINVEERLILYGLRIHTISMKLFKMMEIKYYLKDGPKRSFVREELMLIPEETQLPPDYVQGWS